MKLKVLVLSFFSVFISAYGQSPADSMKTQISFEIRYDLINSTLKSSGRVAASPLKFKLLDWAYAGAAAGAIAISFTQDEYIHTKLRGRGNAALKGLATYAGEPFGNPYITTGSALGLYLIGKGFGKDEVAEPALLAFQSIAISGTSAFLFKMLFHRQRPREGVEANPNVWYGPSFHDDNLSFPSGHTTIAFSIASSLSTYYKDRKGVGIALYSLATITGWSRIHDNEHWFSDVVAGAILGYFVGHTVASPGLYKWSVLPNPAGGMSIGFNYSF